MERNFSIIIPKKLCCVQCIPGQTTPPEDSLSIILTIFRGASSPLNAGPHRISALLLWERNPISNMQVWVYSIPCHSSKSGICQVCALSRESVVDCSKCHTISRDVKWCAKNDNMDLVSGRDPFWGTFCPHQSWWDCCRVDGARWAYQIMVDNLHSHSMRVFLFSQPGKSRIDDFSSLAVLHIMNALVSQN